MVYLPHTSDNFSKRRIVAKNVLSSQGTRGDLLFHFSISLLHMPTIYFTNLLISCIFSLLRHGSLLLRPTDTITEIVPSIPKHTAFPTPTFYITLSCSLTHF